MNELGWGFALGEIAVLEKNLIPRSILEDILKLNLEEALARTRDYFFIAKTSEITPEALEEKFLEEARYLETVCFDLLKEDELKDCIKNFSNPDWLQDKVREYKNILAKEFVGFYFNLLNSTNFLRIQFYGLKQGYWAHNAEELIRNLALKSFFLYGEELRNFYSEGENILKTEKNFLIKFLVDKYTVKFWQKKKEQCLLGPEIVCWYFFAKKLNLDILRFLLATLAYDLDRDKPKQLLNLVYG